jgi:hypothetical protein
MANRCKSRDHREDTNLLKQGNSTHLQQGITLTLGKIKLEFLRELVEGMIEAGQAEWSGKGTRVQALLYWLKPEEWANMISTWV